MFRFRGDPFAFVTLFEYAPVHETMIDGIRKRLRAMKEWTFIDRKVDIRLERIADPAG